MQMPTTHDTSFLARTHALDSGARVRMRLARRSEAGAVRELLERCGIDANELDIRRSLSYDPTRRRVFCACVSVNGRERLVGIGGVDLAPGAEIDTLVVDEASAPGLAVLLGSVLDSLTAPRRRAA